MASSKFWKSENGVRNEHVTVRRPGGHISDRGTAPGLFVLWFLFCVMIFCIHIDIDKSSKDYQMSFGIGRGFAEVQIIIIIQTTM